MKSPGDTMTYYLKRNSKEMENTDFKKEQRKKRNLQKQL